MYNELNDENLTVVGIALDSKDPGQVRNFAQEFQVPYQILLDDGKVSPAYGVIKSHPVTVFIDREGWIAYWLSGALTKEDLLGFIRSLL